MRLRATRAARHRHRRDPGHAGARSRPGAAAGVGQREPGSGQRPPLPYPDGAFTIVVSRFAFHHFSEPRAVLAEMVRVCAPGGRVLVCDVQASDDPRKAAEFNRMEVLRDPSHVRALRAAELRGCSPPRAYRSRGRPGTSCATSWRICLLRSFPNPGDDETIRAIFRASVEDDRLGIPLLLHSAEIRYAYPVVLLCSDRPGQGGRG